jgi:hypothetical protein
MYGMCMDEHYFLLLCPSFLVNIWVEMIMPPEFNKHNKTLIEIKVKRKFMIVLLAKEHSLVNDKTVSPVH